jgi:hypothetical protein
MSGPQVYGAKHIADATAQYDKLGCTSGHLLTAAQMAKCPAGQACGIKGTFAKDPSRSWKNKGSGGSGSGSSSMSTIIIIGVVGLVAVGAYFYLRK